MHFALAYQRGRSTVLLNTAEDYDPSNYTCLEPSDGKADILVNATLESGADYNARYPVEGFRLSYMETEAINIDNPFHKEGVVENPKTAQNDLKRIVELSLKVLTFMNACPEDVTGGSLSKAVKAKKRKGKTVQQRPYWNPWILGSEQVRRGSNPRGGSVSEHWRCGHWRKQPCGKGLSERKIMWIKPTKVGYGKS